jgi:hypothetical protein
MWAPPVGGTFWFQIFIKTLVLGQTKFVSIASNPDILESEVNDFFKRHDLFKDQGTWVMDHASDELLDLVGDYRERLAAGWKIQYYFIPIGTRRTGKDNAPVVKTTGAESL